MRRGAYVLKLLFAAVLVVFAVVSLSRRGETKEVLAEPVMTAEIETPVPTATADPTPKGIHRIRISEEGKITTAEDNYLTRYVQSEDSPAGIRSLAQWKRIGAVSSEQ